jgi:eukaryotic-like serine/threonine-protein kinase
MTPERWTRIEELFHRAVELPAEQRSRFLDRECSGDETLRREVESLIRESDGSEAPFRRAFFDAVENVAADKTSPIQTNIPPLSIEARSSKQIIPWWMYVIGLSFAMTFGLIVYLILWGAGELSIGYTSTFSDGSMVIQTVDDPESQVAKAGLRPGDRLLAVDDLRIRTVRDWTAATGSIQVGRTERWLVARGNDQITLDIVPVAARLRTRIIEGYIQYTILLVTGYFLGFLIAWKRRSDPVALIGAWFIVSASMAFGLPMGWAVPWREFPLVLQALLWIPQLSRFVLEGIFLTFFVLFPRRMVHRRWVWFAIWIPVLITIPWRVKAFYAVIRPGQVAPVPGWILQAGFVRTILYLVAGIAILAISYRRSLDRNEKRRVRVLVVGTAISLASASVLVWFDTFAGRMTSLWIIVWIVSVINVACPVSLAYAILRHRVLDVSVIIRQGLQYALARGGIIGFVPALGVLFILDLAVNSDQRVGDIFRSRGWIYAAAAALSILAYWKRQEWLVAIDRRFFRERYSGQQVLRAVVTEIRTATSFEHAAARVVEQIEAALHPEFLAVLVRTSSQPEYRAVATLPKGQTPPRITPENKVIALLRVLGKPLELLLGDSKWLDERLPRDESEFVRRARIGMLAPIAMGTGQTEALLALGIKRSEEPYTREDEALIETITSSLALLLHQPAQSGDRAMTQFHECPACGTCYDPASIACSTDSAKLMPMRFSRLLSSRYRLERRLGQGGMGTVYAANDTSLERRVAIKLIRDDWVESVEAVQRFRREARAAAGFAHPNVVTIYDYGVEAETRAFLVMELLEGETLRDELKRQKRLSASRLLQVMRGVCAAVQAAHQRDLIHRDLKPENIFIAKTGAGETVKVLDFGIAKFLPSHNDATLTGAGAATHTGILVGTPSYMSPEQLLGEQLDVQWDLWSLAVVAYEGLTGTLPFDRQSGPDWRRAILSGTFTPLDQHLENPPALWQTFFTKSFATDRNHRPRSAEEFLIQLEEGFSFLP